MIGHGVNGVCTCSSSSRKQNDILKNLLHPVRDNYPSTERTPQVSIAET